MIEDCMAGKIDFVISKSISRFARNTLDCLQYIRQLKDKGIAVFFEKENINTMDTKGELLLTIMASLAQQESESLSQNVKLGLQFRYQAGKVQVNHNRFLGYTKDDDGNLIIEPTEAAVIKRIYREYLEGASYRDICNGLMADGILTGAGKKKWIPSTIHKILSNEKYIGDALLQKTITTNLLEKKREINNGLAPQYYVEDSHEAIIPRDLFMRVQEEMVRRANLRSGEDGKKKRIYSSKYALSSLCTCEKCGDIYRRIAWNNRGKHSTVWRCCTRVEHGPGECDAPTIQETDLQAAVLSKFKRHYEKEYKRIKGNPLEQILLKMVDLCEEKGPVYGYKNTVIAKPATEEEITAWEQEQGIILSDSYKHFLRFANGVQFFGNSEYIAGLQGLNSSDEYLGADYILLGEMIGDGTMIGLSKSDGHVYVADNGEYEDKGDFAEFLEYFLDFLEGI